MSNTCLEVDLVNPFNGSLYYSPPIQASALVLYVLGNFLLLFSIIISSYFMKLRVHEYDRLHARSLSLIIAGHLGAFLQLQTGALVDILQAQIPCFFNVLASILVVPVLILPLTVKLFQFQKQAILTSVAAVSLDFDDDKNSRSPREDHVNHIFFCRNWFALLIGQTNSCNAG